MILKIEKDSPVKNIREMFNHAYPFLKIEFFRPSPGEKTYAKRERVKTGLIDPVKPGIVDIGPQQTVKAVERNLSEITGLEAQILRKSGSLWIQTSRTDDWTLAQQNGEGEIACRLTGKRSPLDERIADTRYDME
jgi:hypothetical protein